MAKWGKTSGLDCNLKIIECPERANIILRATNGKCGQTANN